MIKGELAERINQLVRQQVEEDQSFREAQVEIFRHGEKAVRDVASFARQLYDGGINIWEEQEFRERFTAMSLYIDYLHDEFGIDVVRLRSPEATFSFFVQNVYRKNYKYRPILE